MASYFLKGTQDEKQELEKRSVAVQAELVILLESSQAESEQIREEQEEAEERHREAMRRTSEIRSLVGETTTRCHQLEMEIASKDLELQTLMSAIHGSKAEVWWFLQGYQTDEGHPLFGLP